jgi:uncharacterized membrane protein YkvA (DUF1232 family)
MAPQNRLKGSDEAAGFLADLIRHLRLSWVKIIPAVVLLYLIFPLDLIPDLALGLGQLDDLAVILVGLKLFHDLSPSAVVREHEASLTGKSSPWRVVEDESALDQPPTIDAEYRVLDE